MALAVAGGGKPAKGAHQVRKPDLVKRITVAAPASPPAARTAVDIAPSDIGGPSAGRWVHESRVRHPSTDMADREHRKKPRANERNAIPASTSTAFNASFRVKRKVS